MGPMHHGMGKLTAAVRLLAGSAKIWRDKGGLAMS